MHNEKFSQCACKPQREVVKFRHGVDSFALKKPRLLTEPGLFCFGSSTMRPYAKSLVKRQERRLMQSLMERRERKTPEHHSPEWITGFWANRRSMLT